MAISAPIALTVALLSSRLLHAAFGHQYGSATTAVAILMVAGIPGAALTVVTPIALLCRRDYIAKLTVVGLVANVIANLILVPTVGMEGAAEAFLITDVALLAAFYAALPKAEAAATAAAPAPLPAP
jgi:O-antigen/teichoic acid export membrane protein